jgi:dipeptidyl aminopeptidase/acylaminoacyl peptidase
MTAPNRLERDLTAWLIETAVPSRPDYAEEILHQTARIRQRPRWTFVLRRLPIPDLHAIVPFQGRVAWRTLAVVVLLALILAALAVFVGSRPRVPTPFGPAANGVLALSDGDDMFMLDLETSRRRAVTIGPEVDHEPRWSRDGTRLAFLRGPTQFARLVVIHVDGTLIAASERFIDVDSDSIAWSPDGRWIAIAAAGGGRRAIHIVDAASGSSRELPVEYKDLEVYWRPPDGRQLLFRANPVDAGLRLVSVDDGSVEHVPLSGVDLSTVRPLGWTPDGRAILYQEDGLEFPWTHVVDLETGNDTRLDVAFGHVSNDGTRVAGTGRGGHLCVVAIAGGPCRIVGDNVPLEGTFGAGLSWSPDDRWLAVSAWHDEPIWLVDPTDVNRARRLSGGGAASWQRLAP